MHVHMVGNEASGNGCWLRVSTGKIPLYAIMLRALGLPAASIYKKNFDEIYRNRLLECVRESTVDAVCLLAQEAVYHDDGTLREEVGNAFVPNDYILNLARDHEELLPAVSIHPARPDAMD